MLILLLIVFSFQMQLLVIDNNQVICRADFVVNPLPNKFVRDSGNKNETQFKNPINTYVFMSIDNIDFLQQYNYSIIIQCIMGFFFCY